MALSTSLIDYQEEDGSPQESYQGRKFTAKRTFIVPWADRYEFMIDLVGGTRTGPVYVPTDVYPGTTNVICTSFDCQGWGKRNAGVVISASAPLQDTMSYDHAKITATYETMEGSATQDGEPDVIAYRQQTVEGGGFFYTCPKGSLKWADSGIAIDTEPSLFLPSLTLTDTWLYARAVPAAAFDLQGKINGTSVTIGSKTFPEKTVMYLGYTQQQQFTNFGASFLTVSYKFGARREPWDYFIDKSGAWKRVKPQAAATLFTETSFAALFNLW